MQSAVFDTESEEHFATYLDGAGIAGISILRFPANRKFPISVSIITASKY